MGVLIILYLMVVSVGIVCAVTDKRLARILPLALTAPSLLFAPIALIIIYITATWLLYGIADVDLSGTWLGLLSVGLQGFLWALLLLFVISIALAVARLILILNTRDPNHARDDATTQNRPDQPQPSGRVPLDGGQPSDRAPEAWGMPSKEREPEGSHAISLDDWFGPSVPADQRREPDEQTVASGSEAKTSQR